MADCADANTLELNAFESQGTNETPGGYTYHYRDEDLADIAKSLYEQAGRAFPKMTAQQRIMQDTAIDLNRLMIEYGQATGFTNGIDDRIIKIIAICQVLGDQVAACRHELRENNSVK